MLVRSAQPVDAGAVAEIYAHYVATSAATFDESAPPGHEFAARIEASPLPFLVAEDGGRVAGYGYLAAYSDRTAYRYTTEDSVYVAPDARGRGLGKELLRQLLEEGERVGVREVIARIAVTDDSASVALHRAYGFADVGVMRAVGFKLGRWHDVLVMQRSLGARD